MRADPIKIGQIFRIRPNGARWGQGTAYRVAGHVVKAISQLRFLTQRKPPVRFLAAGRVRARTKRAFKFAEANKELFELLLVHS